MYILNQIPQYLHVYLRNSVVIKKYNEAVKNTNK